jgi:hypothetical protein
MSINLGGNNSPLNLNKMKFNVDLSKIAKVRCTKCSNESFTMLGSIKMISPIQSTSGKWDTAIEAQWVCLNCHHPFDPSEYLENLKQEVKKENKGE